ncbi:hypothetical protein KM043_002172 [Ampulex compressa]|nr:hypothetical protein KM043_002172 [Ampulex compressa]
MCAMYYYASKLTAAALSGGGPVGAGPGGGGGGPAGGQGVCRCHEAQREQSSPRRSQQQPPRTQHQRSSARVGTPTSEPTTSEHVVIEHPRPNHYHRHRTKHKVRCTTTPSKVPWQRAPGLFLTPRHVRHSPKVLFVDFEEFESSRAGGYIVGLLGASILGWLRCLTS